MNTFRFLCLLPPCVCSLGFIRYLTVMGNRCFVNTQPEESRVPATPVPYFSNPDVDHLGLATGTSAENNARALRENMVR